MAIFRYHLFDFEFVLKRSLAFTTITATLVLVFYGIFALGNRVFFLHSDSGAVSIVLLSFGMLMLGLGFSPIHRWIRRMVDRRYFPERLEMRQRLTRLAAELPRLGS